MAKPAEPSATAARSLPVRPPARKEVQASRNRSAASSVRAFTCPRASCFQRATMFSTMVTTAAPCTTSTSRCAE